MKWLIFIPFLCQAVVILVDEMVFHLKRGLPKWERIGHPLDTFSILMCMAFPLFVPFSLTALKVYGGFAIFSCLMVTKDEFIHKHHCPWTENWLHALLFLLHPITLACTALIWPVMQEVQEYPWNDYFQKNPELYGWFLSIQAGLVCLFFFYQVIYWNFIWKPTPAKM